MEEKDATKRLEHLFEMRLSTGVCHGVTIALTTTRRDWRTTRRMKPLS
jgi:hypothetical protein